MGNPYRIPWQPPPAADRPAERSWDELAIPLVVLLIGGIRAIPALINGEDFGASATIALIMVALGIAGLVLEMSRRLLPPRS